MSRRVAFGLLLLLAALLPVRVEASRTSVWESNPPSSLTATKTDAAGLLASLAPAARLDKNPLTDAETAEPPLFDLGDIVLADTAGVDEKHFDLGPLTLVELNLLRGPPSSYPETRVGGFELLPSFRVGASPSLSLWGRQACSFPCCELASDSRYDPWGLASDLDPRSNPDVAAALLAAQESQRRAFEDERAEFNRSGGQIRAIEGDALRGGLYYGIDRVTGVGLADEAATYHPFAGAGQAAADLREFKRRYSAPILAVDAATALKSPGNAGKAIGLTFAFAGFADRKELDGPARPEPYEVAAFDDLQAGDVVGDGLGNHHAPQKAPAREIVPGYPQDKKAGAAPAIRLPDEEHMSVTREQALNATRRGAMTPRELVADDVRLLRRNTRAPASAIKKLLDMTKRAYELKKR